MDEPSQSTAAIEAWRNHQFVHSNDHPALARLLFGMVLRDPKWQVPAVDNDDFGSVKTIRPGPEELAWRARPVNVALGAVSAILGWAAAPWRFSPGAANLALALFAFSRPLIAHFSLIKNDGMGALLIFVAAFQLARWRKRPSLEQTVLLGFVLGVLLLAKFYTIPMFLIAMGLVLILKPDSVCWRPGGWIGGRPERRSPSHSWFYGPDISLLFPESPFVTHPARQIQWPRAGDRADPTQGELEPSGAGG